MSKKTKPPLRRDHDFEELDEELEFALRALESANERTVDVLQRMDQVAEPGEKPAADTPGPDKAPQAGPVAETGTGAESESKAEA